jgi:predicted permease
MIDALRQDVRDSLRLLIRQWGFTLAAVATVALGAGANATVFSLVNAVLLRPLPIGEPQRTVNVYGTSRTDRFDNFSYPEFQALRARTQTLRALAAFNEVSAILQEAEVPSTPAVAQRAPAERVVGQITSANFFSTLALRPAAGRFFTAAEEARSAQPAVVLSHSFWQTRFQGRSAVGRTVLLNGHAFTIIGVAPEHFRGTFRGVDYRFWVTIGALPLLADATAESGTEPRLTDPRTRWLQVVGRLAPGVSLEGVAAELTRLRQSLETELGFRQERPGAEIFPTTGLPDSRRAAISGFMTLLAAIAALVLVIACVNLAGMLVGRGLVRVKEIALRAALGASRTRLTRQLLVETTVLLVLGAGAGALIASWTADSLLAFLPSTDVPIVLDLSLDARVLLYTLGTTLAAGLLVGLLPILQINRPDLMAMLRASAATLTGQRMQLRRLLVRAQIATSLLLIIVAGLFARALSRAEQIDPGFVAENVIAATIDVGPSAASSARGLELYRAIEQALRARGDAEQVSFARAVPLGQSNRGGFVQIAGREAAPGEPVIPVGVNTVAPAYFRLMRIPLLRGREFLPNDRAEAQPVAIINRFMAERYWPGADPVGRVFFDGLRRREVTVVGVAADIRFRSLNEAPRPFVYYPLAQHFEPQMVVHVRTRDANALLRALPELLRTIEPTAAVFDAATLEEHIGFALLPQRIAAAVASAFSALGLLLAGVGLYAVVTFWLLQRRHELAIRSALGATPRELLRMVGGEGVRLIASGVILGLLAASGLTHLLRSFLFGLSPFDPIALLGAVTVLAALLLVACLEPARRALRLEPMKVLRDAE